MTDSDKRGFELWSKANAEVYWTEEVFRSNDVMILDDPQVTGSIPYIRQMNPNAHLIYRSHIQIRSDLVEQGDTPQSDIWRYLWDNFICKTDWFVAHPVPEFFPMSYFAPTVDGPGVR